MKTYYTILIILIVCVLGRCAYLHKYEQESWLISAYCSCKKCCGRWSDGYFASGNVCYIGGVANNFLPFGSKVIIQGKTYTVEDRGSKKYFGTKRQRVKHIDIYFDDHQEAKEFGVKWLPVEVK